MNKTLIIAAIALTASAFQAQANTAPKERSWIPVKNYYSVLSPDSVKYNKDKAPIRLVTADLYETPDHNVYFRFADHRATKCDPRYVGQSEPFQIGKEKVNMMMVCDNTTMFYAPKSGAGLRYIVSEFQKPTPVKFNGDTFSTKDFDKSQVALLARVNKAIADKVEAL